MFFLKPRLLIGFVLVVLVLLAGADTAARFAAQHEIASRAQSATGASSASASISGFPFLEHLLVQGSVSGVDVTLHDVPMGQLQVNTLSVHLVDTSIDRTALFDKRQVHVTSIASATASVTVTAAELSAAVGHAVTLPGNGVVDVDIGGFEVTGSMQLSGDVLVMSARGIPLLSSNLGADPFVSSCVLGLIVAQGEATMSCTMAPVPAALLAAVAGS
ncbi:MAG: LmeA family phospholipid-binding protein [Acidimicrobiales bacterium]